MGKGRPPGRGSRGKKGPTQKLGKIEIIPKGERRPPPNPSDFDPRRNEVLRNIIEQGARNQLKIQDRMSEERREELSRVSDAVRLKIEKTLKQLRIIRNEIDSERRKLANKNLKVWEEVYRSISNHIVELEGKIATDIAILGLELRRHGLRVPTNIHELEELLESMNVVKQKSKEKDSPSSTGRPRKRPSKKRAREILLKRCLLAEQRLYELERALKSEKRIKNQKDIRTAINLLTFQQNRNIRQLEGASRVIGRPGLQREQITLLYSILRNIDNLREENPKLKELMEKLNNQKAPESTRKTWKRKIKDIQERQAPILKRLKILISHFNQVAVEVGLPPFEKERVPKLYKDL